MHIFIDESGSFSGDQKGALAAVGALAIPDKALPRIERKYASIRRALPKVGGEVKGRLLSEPQVAKVVSFLVRNHAVFETTAIDVGAHTQRGVTVYKDELARMIEARLPRFNEQTRPEVQKTADQIRATSVPLFLQATTTFDVIQNVIKHVPLYFAQRQPEELGSFTWVVDGKEPSKVTDWEKWWPWHATGALAVRSITDPRPTLKGADYSFFDSYNGSDGKEVGTDLKVLMADLRFSSRPEPGLELVDILVNAVRRAMAGNLGRAGWRDIRRLMIHRREHYIGLLLLENASTEPTDPGYADVVRHFAQEGRSMLSPRFLREAATEEF